MKIILEAWNHGYKELLSTEASLRMLDGYNKTRYSRRKN